MNCPCALFGNPAVGGTFSNEEFLSGSQGEFDFPDNHGVLSLHHYYIFIVGMGMFDGFSAGRISPEYRLAAVGAVENVTLDILRKLRTGNHFINRVLHE